MRAGFGGTDRGRTAASVSGVGGTPCSAALAAGPGPVVRGSDRVLMVSTESRA